MKWPFFKNTKTEDESSTRVLNTPPRPVSNPSESANATLKKTQMISVTEPPTPVTQSATISLSLASFATQLPPELFAAGADKQFDSITVDLPSDLLLPQLAKGKVIITVGELIAHLPKHIVATALPPGMDQHTVNLPIGEIVASIPSDAFAVHGEAPIDLNAPEFAKLPKLFDDTLAEKTDSKPAEVVPDDLPVFVEKQPQPEPVAAVVPKPAAVITPAVVAAAPVLPQPLPVPAPAAAPTPAAASEVIEGLPTHIFVRLRSLVAVMPDNVFATSRENLWQQADPETKVPLPVEQILPLLSTGRVRIRLALAVRAIPPALLANDLPETDESIPLPLAEVISQLPPSLFAVSGHQQHSAPAIEESDDANPFRERSATPALIPEAEPAPFVATVPAPVVEEAEPVHLAEESLADDEADIFTEKTPVVEEPEPLPAPVALVETPVVTPAEPPHVVEPLAITHAVEVPVEPPAASTTTPAAEPALDERRFLINLNRCTVEDLTKLDGVGPALAKRIISFRDAHGHISSLAELRQIPGIGRKTFRAIAGASPETLNRLLGVEHDQELTLQEIVRLTAALPGIDGCILTAADGLFLTGHLPAHLDENRLSVFAPQLFKKVGRYARELSVGNVNRISLFTDEQPVSIFQAGAIYLIVVHDAQRFSKALLRRLTRISEELARLCRQRAVV